MSASRLLREDLSLESKRPSRRVLSYFVATLANERGSVCSFLIEMFGFFTHAQKCFKKEVFSW